MDLEQPIDLEVSLGQSFSHAINFTCVLSISCLSPALTDGTTELFKYPSLGSSYVYHWQAVFSAYEILTRHQVANIVNIGPSVGVELGLGLDVEAALNFTLGASAQVSDLAGFRRTFLSGMPRCRVERSLLLTSWTGMGSGPPLSRPQDGKSNHQSLWSIINDSVG